MQIYPAALIAHEVGTPVYVVHTSAWQSVELIRDLKDKGWPVFGETLAAFLYWTAPEADARDKGAVGKIQPPIRLDRDRDALWTGVLDGTLTSIGTDCQMYPHSSRTDVDFWDAQVGLGPGMGTALSAVHTSGVLTGRATIEDLARVLSENTARRFDLYPQKGQLAVGSDADVVVFDPTETRTVDAGSLHSAAGYSLYEGESLTGWPVQTYVRGHLVFDSGSIVAEAGARPATCRRPERWRPTRRTGRADATPRGDVPSPPPGSPARGPRTGWRCRWPRSRPPASSPSRCPRSRR